MRPLPQGAILVDMNTGRCFKLNRVGAEIWSMIDPSISLREIGERVATLYGLPQRDIGPEVMSLIEHLLEEHLIDPETQPSAVGSRT